MLTNFLWFYVGGLLVTTLAAVAGAKEDSPWDIEFRTLTASSLIFMWPVTVPVTFMVKRFEQI